MASKGSSFGFQIEQPLVKINPGEINKPISIAILRMRKIFGSQNSSTTKLVGSNTQTFNYFFANLFVRRHSSRKGEIKLCRMEKILLFH